MITGRQIEIYKKYNGDIDSFARIASAREKLDMNDEQWLLIERLIEDSTIVQNGKASEEFKLAFESRMNRLDEMTQIEINKLR